MLINFSVSNFLSFNNLTKFSMIAGKASSHNERIINRKDMDILNFTALYGANASGKSNLVKAFDFSKTIITQDISRMSYEDMHFKINKENESKDTLFEYEILLKEKYYAYGFRINLATKKIIGEWLYELSKVSDKCIFERNLLDNQSHNKIIFSDSESESDFKSTIKDVNRMGNVLLLSEIIRRKNDIVELAIFNDIFDWFSNKLVVLFPNSVFKQFHEVFKNQNNENLIQLLKYFDTGIKDYSLSPTTYDKISRDMATNQLNSFESFMSNKKAEIQENLEEGKKISFKGSGILRVNKHLYQIQLQDNDFAYFELLFSHNENKNISFTFGQESDGTRRLIELLDIIYNDHADTTFIIDELDRSFHPQMTWKFIETCLKTNHKTNTQMIITTHESTVMDLSLLRRDEVWFVERNSSTNSSKIYSLEEFKVHNSKKISKDYLIGRYGAVPLFKDFDTFVSHPRNDAYKEE